MDITVVKLEKQRSMFTKLMENIIAVIVLKAEGKMMPHMINC